MLLEIDDLKLDIVLSRAELRAVRGVSFCVSRGETVCLVGESGCGKSLTALSILGLLPARARRSARRLAFEGEDIQNAGEAELASLRGNRISMIFQDPMTSLNPAFTIGNQLQEVYIRHRGATKSAARERALYLLMRCGVSEPERRLRQFPHELSGGLRQRVMIAMALMCEPALLIADEPTTALDVRVQAQILSLLRDLQQEFGLGILMITHDLGVVARIADRVNVMYAGMIVESGTTADVFNRTAHPYTRGLLASVLVPGRTRRGERLGSIPGNVQPIIGEFIGCGFRDRCSQVVSRCHDSGPPVREASSADHIYRCVQKLELCHG